MATRRPFFLSNLDLCLIRFGDNGWVGETSGAVAESLCTVALWPDRPFPLPSTGPARSPSDIFAGSTLS